MKRGVWLAFLRPKDEERYPELKQELQRLSVAGLWIIAVICLVSPLGWLALGLVWIGDIVTQVGLGYPALIFVVGLFLLPISFRPGAKAHARRLGLVAVYLLGMVDAVGARNLDISGAELVACMSGGFIMAMLIGIASLPVKPLHLIVLALALCTSYLVELVATGWWAQMAGAPALHLAFMVMMAPISIALGALVYRQRASAYLSRFAAERALKELREAQVRVCVSEHSASQGRFAAALSHELNSPLGALASAFDTVVRIHKRQLDGGEPQDRLEDLFELAIESGRQSTERLKAVAERMRQMIALGEAEERLVDINHLLTDVLALIDSEKENKLRVGLDLKPLPPVHCRPQQVSAVLSNLVRNAASAIDGDGMIWVSTAHRPSEVVLEVRDNGRGISEDKLEGLFEPAFRADNGRVGTTNWGLFIAQSIVTSHGGHIEIDSKVGEGTTARVVLPAIDHGATDSCMRESCRDARSALAMTPA